jgi:NosR/NirI family nitrous oxide reductase transcriptional regulator
VFLVLTADNKNPYCEWFCPFGATQECVGAIGRAKVRSPGKFRPYLKWLHRGLAWLAIVLALIFRDPGISSYEVFSAMFDGVGSTLTFAVLGIVLLASLVIKRPWCTYLCPLQPVSEFNLMIRMWIVELWEKTARKTA